MGKVILGACGDISFKGRLEKHIRQNGIEFAFADVKDSLGRADVLFGNAESVMVPDGFKHEGALVCSDIAAGCLKDAGFHVLNIANNHLLDCGRFGLLHTYKTIAGMGIKVVGGGRDEQEAKSLQVVESKGLRIGFLGYQEPNNCTYEGGGGRMSYFRLPEAIEDVKRYKQQVDILVVSFHGDMEFNPSPSLLKVDFCRKLADSGADIVLCHHPHVPHGVERWGNSIIAYSLGNFAFETDGYMLNGYPHTGRSHLLFIEIEEGRVSNWYREYFRIDKDEGRPRKLNESEYREEEKYYLYLDELVKSPEKLRQMWYEASMEYLKKYWAKLAKAQPEEFIEQYGFEIFKLTENRHWVAGIREMILGRYEANRERDTEFTRPNIPDGGRVSVNFKK